eukprot:Hpha_TRINITY_DN22459_c0_g1::TRINITY_DN22459_c0_g1_i1::g.94959::m.94959
MRAHVESGRLLLSSTALSVAVRAGDFRLVKAMLLYPWVDFSTRTQMPVTDAVMRDDVRITKLLLLGPVTDVNKGCPLARAIERGNLEMVKLLAGSLRINPNRGGALYRAVASESLPILGAVLGHPRLIVNRFAGGMGTTALCKAISLRNVALVKRLLQHPKIDVNRGFLLTPLQTAVDAGDPDIISVLLRASTPTPFECDRCLGVGSPPLQMAVEAYAASEDMGEKERMLTIVQMLLRESSCSVTPKVMELVEKEDLPEVEQAVVDAGRRLVLGRMWQLRVVWCLLAGLVQVAAQWGIVLVVAVYLDVGALAAAVVTAACVIVSCALCTYGLRSRRCPCLRLVPGLYELGLVFGLLFSICVGAPRRRTQNYTSLQTCFRYDAVAHNLPQAALQSVLSWATNTNNLREGEKQFILTCAGLNLLFAAMVGVYLLIVNWDKWELRARFQSRRRQRHLVPTTDTSFDSSSARAMQPRVTVASDDSSATQTFSYADSVRDSRQSIDTEMGELNQMRGGRRMSHSRRLRPPHLDLQVVRKWERDISLPPRCVAAEKREEARKKAETEKRVGGEAAATVPI